MLAADGGGQLRDVLDLLPDCVPRVVLVQVLEHRARRQLPVARGEFVRQLLQVGGQIAVRANSIHWYPDSAAPRLGTGRGASVASRRGTTPPTSLVLSRREWCSSGGNPSCLAVGGSHQRALDLLPLGICLVGRAGGFNVETGSRERPTTTGCPAHIPAGRSRRG